MDIERSCIEILLRGIGAEDIGGKKCSYMRIDREYFHSIAAEWTKKYTGDEILQIYEWLMEKLDSGEKGIFSFIEDLAKHFLENNKNRICLRVKSEGDTGTLQLLRWRELTVSLGEDIFCAAYLAGQEDMLQTDLAECMTAVFTGFDYDSFRELFGKNEDGSIAAGEGMAENHFHLKGSMPVFLLNWVCLMNQIGERKDYFNRFSNYLSPRMVVQNGSSVSSDISSQCQHAAYYRFYLWNRIRKNDLLLQEPLFRNPERIYEWELPILQRYIAVARGWQEDCLDYAATGIWKESRKKPGKAIVGERYFLYQCFTNIRQGIFTKQDMNLFYRYLVLSLRVRSEMVQTNRRIGFYNFASYQNRKEDFIENFPLYKKEIVQLAVNATKEYQNISTMELRITPKDTATETLNQIRLYDKQMELVEPNSVFYVLHFPKYPEEVFCLGEPRNYRVRKKLDIQRSAMLKILQSENMKYQYEKVEPRVRGFDACSGEVGCRPEVFAQTYRWLKYHALGKLSTHFTYHVGEDFLDLTDGIRAVDEAVRFLELPLGSRIGHGMAIALDAAEYYQVKNNNVVLRRQDLLDNICWVLGTCKEWNIYIDKELEKELESKAEELYQCMTVSEEPAEGEIGCKSEISEQSKKEAAAEVYEGRPFWIDYFRAWKLRGDRPQLYLLGEKEFVEYLSRSTVLLREECAFLLNDELTEIRNDPRCRSYYSRYHFDSRMRKEGNKREIFHVSYNYIDVINRIQEELRYRLEKKQIYIEANPSSNYMIGPFERYEQHPMLRMYGKNLIDNLSSRLCVSINTDDQGVFQTSLEMEYAIMYTSLCKCRNKDGSPKYTEKQVLKWLLEIKEFGKSQVFSAVK